MQELRCRGSPRCDAKDDQLGGSGRSFSALGLLLTGGLSSRSFRFDSSQTDELKGMYRLWPCDCLLDRVIGPSRLVALIVLRGPVFAMSGDEPTDSQILYIAQKMKKEVTMVK